MTIIMYTFFKRLHLLLNLIKLLETWAGSFPYLGGGKESVWMHKCPSHRSPSSTVSNTGAGQGVPDES
jgi:hypothetical protein